MIGETTGVYIPINDWEYLKRKYKEIEREEKDTFAIPDWHKEIVIQRLKLVLMMGLNGMKNKFLNLENVSPFTIYCTYFFCFIPKTFNTSSAFSLMSGDIFNR